MKHISIRAIIFSGLFALGTVYSTMSLAQSPVVPGPAGEGLTRVKVWDGYGYRLQYPVTAGPTKANQPSKVVLRTTQGRESSKLCK